MSYTERKEFYETQLKEMMEQFKTTDKAHTKQKNELIRIIRELEASLHKIENELSSIYVISKFMPNKRKIYTTFYENNNKTCFVFDFGLTDSNYTNKTKVVERFLKKINTKENKIFYLDIDVYSGNYIEDWLEDNYTQYYLINEDGKASRDLSKDVERI